MSDQEAATAAAMHDGRVRLIAGDCRDAIRLLADNSIDSVVTDPPYALVSIQKRFGKDGAAPAKHGTDGLYARASAGFMGKQWDTGEVAFATEFWSEVMRVLKPGGHVLAFGGTRTYHRLACAIEDAGFEIRDQIGWLYGSGFPKSHNQHGDWDGWGTALKPAWEPIVLARKPLVGTVATNLAAHGVGAINIDDCRVPGEPWTAHRATGLAATKFFTEGEASVIDKEPHDLGRWPANIIHDGSDEVIEAFPDANGQQGYVGPEHGDRASKGIYGDFGPRPPSPPRVEADKSAARFFYCAKASRADRDAGLALFDTQAVDMLAGHRSRRMDEIKRPDGAAPATGKNTHPTVKPTDLMRYLCRLVTPPGGTVLDPFMGSGSTGKAAVMEGFQFVGIEREAEYMPIAAARIAYAIGVADGTLPAVAPKAKKPANDNQLDIVDWITEQEAASA